MNVQDILTQYSCIDEEVAELKQQLNKKLDERVEIYNTLQSAKLTGMPHNTEISDQTGKAVELLIDTCDREIKKLAEKIDNLICHKEELDEALEELETIEKTIVKLRYVKMLPMRKVGYMVHCSKSEIYRKHDEILIKLKAKIS